ncbi:kinase-like domain-containing protein [Rhizophagus irregularis DAOM 181602=DAOM 197198]|uniref:Pbs2p n=3 Tax=Rhizophagus irregularis TaxID=588596 RepID=A0A015L4Q1_RHIIW|nr:Pbs2p [Rhizophagus irregularis DAOM 197198w]GBC26521.1 kinase-like domain-containing protein [Rhizophagus irregularis DAOM 181602=DAOM 197198]
MNSNNLNEDFYQTAINYYGIKEILENFGNEKERIGQGSCIVYKTKCESLGGILIAIKEVNITSDDCKNRTIKTFVNELKIYNRIDNGRIIQFYGISRNVKERLYYLVLEYANQGNLREYINVKNCNENGFEWTERVFLATQIAEGLCYLHDELNIAHRDLHTKNILINDGNIKISDFGLSKNLESTMSSGNKFFGIIPFIDPHKLNNRNVPLDKRSDIYSLGMVLWEISSCQELIKGTPIDYMKIYTNCWQSEPDFRPLISQILLQLQSMSLEPIFEGDDDKNSIYLLPPSDTSKNFISGYSPSLSSLAISENLASSFLSTNTICKKCEIQFKNYHWCRECEAQVFHENFPNWTCGDKDLDKLIQDSQLNATNHNDYFEWIDYNQFTNIKRIVQGSYCEIYTATWLDGIREVWDTEFQQWVRTKDAQIILRKFRFDSTINNLRLHLDIKNTIRCYGFTQDLETKSYHMVLKYADGGNLRQYIRKKFPCRGWFKKLSILKKIIEGLHNIHKANYIHRDLYPGNILILKEHNNLEVYISELDSCANLNSEPVQQLYGNLSYIAPEVIVENGNLTSIKSDIYSIGIIMWELVSGDEPYSDYEIDNEDELILDIINGVRPNNVIGTPKCYHELMQKCLDADPEKRPTTLNLLEELHAFTTAPFKKHQFEAADRRVRGQPLGTRPSQLTKDNVKIVVESINVAEAYAGTTSFRFTNRSLQFDFSLPKPKNAIEKSLYFNGEGLLDE